MALVDPVRSLLVAAADRLIGASGSVANAAQAVRRDMVAAAQRRSAAEAVRRGRALARRRSDLRAEQVAR